MTSALPATLGAAIDAELKAYSGSAIRAATERLSEAYRAHQGIPAALSAIDRAAYLAVRFPSTFAAASAVWQAFESATPTNAVASVLDAAAGPGTAALAANGLFPAARFTLAERDAGWRAVAERLAKAAGIDATFRTETLPANLQPHDVVVVSYALNEVPPAELARTTDLLWRAAGQALVVIEPGTPRGFDTVTAVRTQVLAAGGHAAAPCTHNATCPMTTADWCHRPVRVARSAAHRAAKQGTLSFEDEKFSYLIMTREPPARRASGRIVRRPMRNAGHVHLDICSDGALRRTTIARSDKQHYRLARDANWGDTWPSDQAD